MCRRPTRVRGGRRDKCCPGGITRVALDKNTNTQNTQIRAKLIVSPLLTPDSVLDTERRKWAKLADSLRLKGQPAQEKRTQLIQYNSIHLPLLLTNCHGLWPKTVCSQLNWQDGLKKYNSKVLCWEPLSWRAISRLYSSPLPPIISSFEWQLPKRKGSEKTFW